MAAVARLVLSLVEEAGRATWSAGDGPPPGTSPGEGLGECIGKAHPLSPLAARAEFDRAPAATR